MPDTAPAPLTIERGPLLSLADAARLTNRPVRVLQRWVKSGDLPCRFKDAKYPHGYLVTYEDLATVTAKKRWGGKRGRKPRLLTTEAGRPVLLRTQERTDSYQE